MNDKSALLLAQKLILHSKMTVPWAEELISAHNADLVARTEARWREFAGYVRETLLHSCENDKPCGCDICNVVDSANYNLFTPGHSGWLSKHDAEVAARAVEPWRETLQAQDDLSARERNDSMVVLEMRRNLLSPAPPAEEAKPACEKCGGAGWVTGHPVDFGNGPEGMDEPCPSCQRPRRAK